jgi:predicted RNase H-like nuclease
VFETYPVLALIALGWMLPDSRLCGRLPKYNPATRSKFSLADWMHVCEKTAGALRELGLSDTPEWIDTMSCRRRPTKGDQDGLDACLCLLVALHMVEQKECLMVGDMDSGYIVVPYSVELVDELDRRCARCDQVTSEWVRSFRLTLAPTDL